MPDLYYTELRHVVNLTEYQNAMQTKAKHKASKSGEMFFVIGKDERCKVIPWHELPYRRQSGKYWRIDFIAFPRRRR